MNERDFAAWEQTETPDEQAVEIVESAPTSSDENAGENAERTPADHLASVGKVVAGAAVAAVGVPMLVLPGPGLAAIAIGGLVAAKGASELTGKENPVINEIEDHPEYQAAAEKAKKAGGAVAGAVADAAKETPAMVAGAGKAVLDVVDNNLPENIRGAVDTVTPVVKGAAEAATPLVEAAGKGVNAGLRALGAFAEGVIKRK